MRHGMLYIVNVFKAVYRMTEKRIMLVESGQFLGGVIHRLFEQQEQLRVIETAPPTPRALLREVAQHNPEVVVLDDTLPDSFLAHLLRYMQNSDIRVVVVNANRNEVSIYQKQQIDVRQPADLFAVLSGVG